MNPSKADGSNRFMCHGFTQALRPSLVTMSWWGWVGLSQISASSPPQLHSSRGLTEQHKMFLQDGFLLALSPSSLLGSVALVLLLCLVSRSFSRATRREPPGPRALPLLGNLLHLDLSRPHETLCQVTRGIPEEYCFQHSEETKSEIFLILVVQEIWTCVQSALWTQESGGTGQSQDHQRGSGRQRGTIWRPRHRSNILRYEPRSWYVHPSNNLNY